MKIKHWQGYGSVEAKKLSLTVKNKIAELRIKVSGNHEYGIELTDEYDIANWLVKRFDKSFTDYRKIIDIETEMDYDIDRSCEICYYCITYRKED